MLVSTFVQILHDHSLQNVSRDFFDDDGWVNIINMQLNFLYHFLNRKDIWQWSIVDETVNFVGTSKRDFDLSYPIHGVITGSVNERGLASHSGVWGNGDQGLNYKHFVISDQDRGFYTIKKGLNALDSISTGEEFDTLRIAYKRGPTKILENGNAQLDIPEDLVSVLLDLCLWRTLGVGYEQGASLAQFYRNQAREGLENYAASLGHDIPQAFINEGLTTHTDKFINTETQW